MAHRHESAASARRRYSTIVVAALAAAAVAAVGARSAPAHDARCSASRLSATARSQTGLPPAVARMRARIVRAAVACDYETLERLAREKGRSFEFTYAARRSPAAYWRRLERTNSEDVLAKLVKILDLPYARSREGFYIWPSAHRDSPTAADWRALRAVYPQKVIDRMRRAGSGYIGHRVAITRSGDWLYFVAGD